MERNVSEPGTFHAHIAFNLGLAASSRGPMSQAAGATRPAPRQSHSKRRKLIEKIDAATAAAPD
jgi:hypothetical protein